MIVKGKMDTGTCCGVNKCAEIVFRKSKMIKGEGLAVLEEKMDAFLDPNKNKIYKDKINVKLVIERIKKEIRKRQDLTGLNLNDKKLMKAFNC